VPLETPWKAGAGLRIASDYFVPSSVVAIVNSKQIYLSENGGDTWREITLSEFPSDVLATTWNDRTGTLYAGTRNNGVLRIPLRNISDKSGKK
jgi:hypothetical protein